MASDQIGVRGKQRHRFRKQARKGWARPRNRAVKDLSLSRARSRCRLNVRGREISFRALLGLGEQIGLPGVQVNRERNMFMDNQPFAADLAVNVSNPDDEV